MRTLSRVLTLLGVLVLLVPGTARADWQLTPFLGLTFKGDTTLFDFETATGNTHWTFQQDNPPLIDGVVPPDIVSSRTVALMGNVILTIPRSWNEYGLRPFVSGGIGMLSATATDALDFLPVDTKLLGYNVGGGAVGFLTDRVGLRFDLRYFSN